MSGDLDEGAAAVVAEVIAGQLRAGRLFLRLDLGALRRIDHAAAEVIVSAHERLLAARGALLITEVSPPILATLQAVARDRLLLLVAATGGRA